MSGSFDLLRRIVEKPFSRPLSRDMLEELMPAPPPPPGAVINCRCVITPMERER